MADASDDALGAENDGLSGGGNCGCRTAPTSGTTQVPSGVTALALAALALTLSRRRAA
jgi:MYXO-CTERM domain-containing protein